MINKLSKLYKDQDYTIALHQDAHHTPLPALKPIVKVIKQKTTPLGIMLKGVIKERMFGQIITSIRKDKSPRINQILHCSADDIQKPLLTARKKLPTYHHIITPRNHRYDTNIKKPEITRYPRNKIEEPQPDELFNSASFISSIQQCQIDIFKESKTEGVRKTLPKIQKKKSIEQDLVSKDTWQLISFEGLFSKDLFVQFMKQRFSDRITNYFIRYFEPPFDHDFKRYNEFVVNLLNEPLKNKQIFMFQVFDIDRDGLLSSEDLFKIYKDLPQCQNKPIIQSEIYRLSSVIKTKQFVLPSTQSIQQYLSVNHDLSLNHFNSVISDQHKPLLESSIKKYTGYKNTFHVTQHNEQTRLHKIRLQQIKTTMRQGLKSAEGKGGMSLSNYLDLSENQLLQCILKTIR